MVVKKVWSSASPDLRRIILWVPFLEKTCAKLTGIVFIATQLDWMFWGFLPAYCRYLITFGLLLCFLNATGGSFDTGPDSNVHIDSGSGIIGSGDSVVELMWVCASMRGWRSSMEDAHIATTMRQAKGGDVGLFAVLDGHGGWQVSAAAEIILQQLVTERLKRGSLDTAELLPDSIMALDAALHAGPLGIGHCLSRSFFHPFSSTGSTACVTAIDAVSGQIVCANTGDSRAILCRGGKAVSLSEDHKPESPEERTRIVQAGGRVTKMGPCHRVDGCLNLSRALGDFQFKTNSSIPPSAQKISAMPTTHVQKWDALEAGHDNFLIVACDGIFERLDRQKTVDYVRSGLKRGQSADEVMRGLLHHCCARSQYEPGTDNETAVLVQWRKVPPVRTETSPANGHGNGVTNGHANGHSNGSSNGTSSPNGAAAQAQEAS